MIARIAGLALATAAVTASGAERPSVILLSLDTLRADRLGAWGSDRPVSPTLDALAARGAQFPRAIAESSWTLPSHMTLFTGLHPTTHGVTEDRLRLADSIPTAPELFRRAGWRTAAITDGGWVDPDFGFGRGFESYDDRRKELRLTLWRGRRFIESLPEGEPFFLFLHSYAVHCPYHPREEYANRLRTRPPADHLATKDKCGNPDFNAMRLRPGQFAFLSDQYDAGVREADDALRAFVRFLDERDGLENTIFVVLSDHGEEFGEHGQVGHERTLYLESLHVPLIVAGGGVPRGLVPLPAGLVDVLPTVCELAGLAPPAGPGRSLVPAMRAPREAAEPVPLFSELDRDVRLRSVVTEDRHLIVDVERGLKQLFAIDVDGREQHVLPETVGVELEGLLEAHLEALPTPDEVGTTELDAAKLEELRALGYVE